MKENNCYGVNNLPLQTFAITKKPLDFFFSFQLKIPPATFIQSLNVEMESVLTTNSPVMAFLIVRINPMKNCSTVVSVQ